MPRRHLHGRTPWNAIRDGAASIDATNRVGLLMRHTRTTVRRIFGATTASTLALTVVTLSHAQEMKAFDIEAQSLSSALLEYSEQSDTNVIVSGDIVDGKSAPALSGEMASDEALEKLLSGSGLKYEADADGSVMIMLASVQQTEQRNGLFRLAQADTQSIGSVSDARAAAEAQIDTIVVTAQKREQKNLDVPISIVAIGGEELDARGIENVLDLSLTVPGLSVADSGVFQRRIYLRGLGNIAGSQSLVGIYLDEVPLSSGNPSQNFDLRTFDLDRVEVLKGPQGTLYGQGSVGGTLRFITNYPNLEEAEGRLNTSAYFTEDGAPSQQIQGVVNIPLIDDTLAVRVVGSFENVGGWIDQPEVDQRDINDMDIANVRVKTLWLPTDALEVSGMVNIFRNTSGAPSVGEDADGNYFSALQSGLTPSGHDNYEIYNLSAVYDFGAFALSSSSSYSNRERELSNFKSTGGIEILWRDSTGTSEFFTQEFRLSSTSDSNLQWTIGGFYQDIEFTSALTIDAGPEGGDLNSIFTSSTDEVTEQSESFAAFGELSYTLGAFEIGAGVRYYEDDRSFLDSSGLQEDTFDDIAPRAFIRYAVTDDINIYASAGKGFRSGGFNSLGEPRFDPESTWSYELGAKGRYFDGTLAADIALFYSDSSSFQQEGSIPGTAFVATQTVGDVEIKGVDWAFNWRVTDQLQLSFNGNYVDTELVDISVGGTQLVAGDELNFISEYQCDVGLIYDFEVSNMPGMFRVDYTHQAGQETRNRGIGFLSESDDVGLIGASADLYLNDAVTLGIFGRNLENEREFLDPNEAVSTAPRATPRTYGFRVDVRF